VRGMIGPPTGARKWSRKPGEGTASSAQNLRYPAAGPARQRPRAQRGFFFFENLAPSGLVLVSATVLPSRWDSSRPDSMWRGPCRSRGPRDSWSTACALRFLPPLGPGSAAASAAPAALTDAVDSSLSATCPSDSAHESSRRLSYSARARAPRDDGAWALGSRGLISDSEVVTPTPSTGARACGGVPFGRCDAPLLPTSVLGYGRPQLSLGLDLDQGRPLRARLISCPGGSADEPSSGHGSFCATFLL
jgi:hypothetical protein